MEENLQKPLRSKQNAKDIHVSITIPQQQQKFWPKKLNGQVLAIDQRPTKDNVQTSEIGLNGKEAGALGLEHTSLGAKSDQVHRLTSWSSVMKGMNSRYTE
jgi:hypothetical protein